jgi:uncharacterized membrane protein
MTSPTADTPLAEDAPVFFDVVLQPHRSLTPHGFNVLMGILGAVSFVAGTVFYLLGAWPVIGFFGLDVALVYVAFRLNYRSARQTERVRLVEDALTVERIGVRGDRRWWQFQPYWLRVVFEEKDEDRNRLYIASHGRSLVLGAFLGPAERKAFAGKLADAMTRWRAYWRPSAGG